MRGSRGGGGVVSGNIKSGIGKIAAIGIFAPPPRIRNDFLTGICTIFFEL